MKFEEKDGIDYAAVTVQLPGGKRVPFLFTVKQLIASGKPESFSGEFLVPIYRGSSFLDPEGRGGSQGYDNAVALLLVGEGMRKSWRRRMSRTRLIPASSSCWCKQGNLGSPHHRGDLATVADVVSLGKRR
ncbi:unnamed protein product [Linum tenue]|uniref:Uncharacterized protein n=1 Tax=Linum tenue TaxID=586396 RepID=A0AAV0IMP1_9ROSI|nr:unnamed protein product [Linum tenue]CAI0398750.1 unnamed protein product [Linum tenue]CAI0398865.1 unnamed protein product [Linum tenue]